MSQTTSVLAAPSPVGRAGAPTGISPDAGNTFRGVFLRRVKMLIAIVADAVLLRLVVWPLISPPPWSSSALLVQHGWPLAMVSTLVVCLMAALTIALSTWITQPDFPHAGMLCVMVALCVLAMMSGPMHLLLRVNIAQLRILYANLAYECVLWSCVLVVAEFATRMLWHRLFSNADWVTRATGPLPRRMADHKDWYAAPSIIAAFGPVRSGGGGERLLANVAGFVTAGAIGGALCMFLMRNEMVGQVLFACFVAFFVGSFVAVKIFPMCAPLSIWLSAPATAIVGYLLVGPHFRYPGHEPFSLGRAVPIDYVSAGVAGAIVGYYSVIGWVLHDAAAAHGDAAE